MSRGKSLAASLVSGPGGERMRAVERTVSAVSPRSRYPGPIGEARKHPHDLVQQRLCHRRRPGPGCWTAIPPELFDINLYDYDDEGQVSPAHRGARGKLSGDQACWQAIQAGRLWVNLRQAETGCPELWAAAMRVFPPRSRATYPSLKSVMNVRPADHLVAGGEGALSFRCGGGGAVPPAWPQARLSFIPATSAHLPERSMEQVVTRQKTEELPYVRAFEADAQVMDLEPGEALTWPLYAPHRVENLDRFCVSLSMDFQTWGSRLRNGALYTHAVMRSRGGSPRFTDGMTRPELAARWAASLALKRVGGLKSKLDSFERDFEPEVGARDGAGALTA